MFFFDHLKNIFSSIFQKHFDISNLLIGGFDWPSEPSQVVEWKVDVEQRREESEPHHHRRVFPF